MKVLITIWILYSVLVLPQTNCQNYETLLKKVDKNYAELSQRPFLNYTKYTFSQKDTLKVNLFNVKGEVVYQKNFGLLNEGRYIVKFSNPKCSGVYFVSLEIGNQPSYKKLIQITSEAFPLNEIETNSIISTSIIDGVWQRSYRGNFIPALQPSSNLYKIEYHFNYDLQVQFADDSYKIISKKTDEENGAKEIKTFEGRFTVNSDTLNLYEESKLNKVFQYKIEEDTLSISYFVSNDEKTDKIEISIERNIFNTEIQLVGKYHK